MSVGFEFYVHDSELQTLCADPAVNNGATPGRLTLVLSAAFVRRDDGVVGHLRGVRLVFTGARWAGSLADCVGRITGGHVLRADGARLTRWPLPATFTGGLQAELVFGHGTVLAVLADGLRCDAGLGATGFTESLAC